MTTLYAQPYDMQALGFYFDSLEEFNKKSASRRNALGQPVEEFEIHLIDADDSMGVELFHAWGPHQGNIGDFFQALDEWSEYQMLVACLLIGENIAGAATVFEDGPDSFDVELYCDMTMEQLAEQFVDDGLYGDIPEHLANYIDYAAIARELAHDYTETEIDGGAVIYRAD